VFRLLNKKWGLTWFRSVSNCSVSFSLAASSIFLILAIRNVLAGNPYLSPGVSQKVIAGYLNGKRGGSPATAYDSLSAREKEVLKLIAEGYKNREIGELLCISLKTVEKHRANLMKKLDLHNAAALTSLALEKGLVTH